MQGRVCTQYIFWSCNIYFKCYAFSCENPFTCKSKKEDKKALGFKILHFYGSFSNELTVHGIDTLTSTIVPAARHPMLSLNYYRLLLVSSAMRGKHRAAHLSKQHRTAATPMQKVKQCFRHSPSFSSSLSCTPPSPPSVFFLPCLFSSFPFVRSCPFFSSSSSLSSLPLLVLKQSTFIIQLHCVRELKELKIAETQEEEQLRSDDTRMQNREKRVNYLYCAESH